MDKDKLKRLDELLKEQSTLKRFVDQHKRNADEIKNLTVGLDNVVTKNFIVTGKYQTRKEYVCPESTFWTVKATPRVTPAELTKVAGDNVKKARA